MKKFTYVLLSLIAVSSIATAQTNRIKVNFRQTRSLDPTLYADAAVRDFAKRLALLTAAERAVMARGHAQPVFSMPARVEWSSAPVSGRSPGYLSSRSNGIVAGGSYMVGERTTRAANTRSGGNITLVFNTASGRTFDDKPGYQALLQNIFNQAQPLMNAIFGMPQTGGPVIVSNYDANIGDRQAVAGGYYLPDNGSGQPEIRFPEYNSEAATVVNFIHTLLLAYQGSTPYQFDAFQEGLVRAATMFIARTPSLASSIDSTNLTTADLESVLDSSYTVGPLYDWDNQRALGGSVFIAPNLLNAPLPAGGSIGGLYLLRYEMSGSAWYKVLTEYPNFIADLNAAVYATPSLAGDVPGLVAQSQTILNTLRVSSPTVEGLSFAEWFKRQYILETKDTNGLKLLVQATPVSTGLSGPDFGVFAIELEYFQRTTAGSENLLSGTSYPIYWDFDFTNRLFPAAQDDIITINAAYGSVEPNFPDLHSTQPYRLNLDIPVQDQITRLYLPVGAIATATSTSVSDFFGTVEGATATTGTTISVQIQAPGITTTTIPVTNGAFGTAIGANFQALAGTVTINVLSTSVNGTQTLLTRQVDKDLGSLAVDLRVGADTTFTIPGGLPAGMTTLGLPIDPYLSFQPDVLGVSSGGLLLARYDSSSSGYDLFPSVEPIKIGNGYFFRAPSAMPLTVEGRASPISYAVSLRPGWNLITTPINESVSTANIQVVHSTDFPNPYSTAAGTNVGTAFFGFTQGAPNLVSGVPEAGTFTPATSFVPGQAYFVRCFDAEGDTLLFQQQNGSFLTRSVTSPSPSYSWLANVQANGLGITTSCQVGMSTTATRSFDPKVDSELPPSIGGFQISVKGSTALYRSIHPVTNSETYSLQLDGLRPGTWYTVMVSPSVGYAPFMTMKNDTDNISVPIRSSSLVRFNAKKSTQTFELTVGGVH